MLVPQPVTALEHRGRRSGNHRQKSPHDSWTPKRPRERSARSRLKQLGDSVELGEVLHRSGQVGEAQFAPAFCGTTQPLQCKGYRGGIDFGHLAEINHARALAQMFFRRSNQPGYGIKGHRAFENERVALASHHVLPAFERSGWRFFAASDLIRPSTPCSRTSPAKVSR